MLLCRSASTCLAAAAGDDAAAWELTSTQHLNFRLAQVQSLGWPSVFYVFGSLGLGWFVYWQRRAASLPSEDPLCSQEEQKYITGNTVAPVRLLLGSAKDCEPLSASSSQLIQRSPRRSNSLTPATAWPLHLLMAATPQCFA